MGSDKAIRDPRTENCHHRLYRATIFSSNKRAKECVANTQTDPPSSGNLPSSGLVPCTFPLSLEDTGLSHACLQTRGHQPFKNRIHGFISCYFTGTTDNDSEKGRQGNMAAAMCPRDHRNLHHPGLGRRIPLYIIYKSWTAANFILSGLKTSTYVN